MEDSTAFPFAGNLDPRAQEFVPLNPMSSPFYFPYTSLPPPLPPPPPSYGLFPPDPRMFTFFNSQPHPMMFSPPPPPPPRPCFNDVSAVQRLSPPSNSPTRSLSLLCVPRDVTESTVRRDLEVFGEVRGVQMERITEGIVTVHFYDLRHAKRAVREICGRHMQHQEWLGSSGGGSVWRPPSSSARGFVSGRPVWAHFVLPATNAVPGGCNQGTLVIFNLDPEVSSTALRQIFQVYGSIKELRETPYKKHQRFIEFYDVRDAAKAFDRMNGEEIYGKQVVIEFSRPGGIKNKFTPFRQPQLPFQPRPILAPPPPLRQSITLMKDKSTNVNPNNGVDVVEASMRSLCIMDDDNNKTREAESETKSKNVAKWRKRKQMKSMELSQFLISEETMDDPSCRDQRTTLMIKNIPNKYSQKLLLNMLDNHCIHINEAITEERDEHEAHHNQPFSSYDFVYLPMDFNNKCNVGYGFVNMTSPEAAWRLYKAFHLQRWEVFNSHKICQVTYARVQGLEDLKEHFKSSKFPCEAELYLPVFFSPPRDGKQLTEPVSIKINGVTGINSNHLFEPMDGQDHSVGGSCCGSDNDNSQEDGLSGSSIDGGRSLTVVGETSF